jgi:lysophospholipase L1-like esterase
MLNRTRRFSLTGPIAAGVVVVAVGLFLITGRSPQIANTPPPNTSICCFGDSLVEGVGADGAENTYPAQLATLLGKEVAVCAKSGDTTAQGLAKIEHFDSKNYGIIVVTLGGNDIIKRVDWAETEKNLHTIFKELTGRGAVVVYTGVTGPLNVSRNRLYKKICAEHGVLFVPEIMDGILGNMDLKSDEVHPNADGYALIAKRVATALREAELVQ